MMKPLIIASTVAVVLFSANSMALTFVAGDDSPATKLCMSITQNRLLPYVLEKRDNMMGDRQVAKLLSCNGMRAKSFATFAGADKIVNKLSHYDHTNVIVTDLAQIPEDTIFVVSAD